MGAAYRLLDEAHRSGWSTDDIVTELLVGVQHDVGQRWQTGSWTIADEHAASAIVDDLLGVLGRDLPPPRSHPSIAIACAEGEWHVTPARMATLRLRSHGWRTHLLGASTPSSHLHRTLAATRPSFLWISCTYPLALSGAGRIAAVAADLEISTVAGGAAFGRSERRARRLGIDGWAPDVREAARLCRSWLDRAPPRLDEPPVSLSDESILARRWAHKTTQAIQRLASSDPSLLDDPGRSIDALREQLMDLQRVAHIAVVCDDPSLLTEHLEWLEEAHPSQGLPRPAIVASLDALRLRGP